MASLETITLEYVPQTHSVHVAVYRNVENADFLQQQLLARNKDFEYAFIDATSVSYIFAPNKKIYSIGFEDQVITRVHRGLIRAFDFSGRFQITGALSGP